MIMKGRAPLHLPGAGLLCLAVLAAASLPAWAASEQQPPAPPVPVVVQSEPPKPPSPAVVPVPAVRVREARQAQPPPPQPVPKVVPLRTAKYVTVDVKRQANLPADGRQLLDRFEADRTAIEREADQKVEALRAELVKTLENLQAEYTKAGKLDEAVAIRDYLRTGPPETSRIHYVRYRGK